MKPLLFPDLQHFCNQLLEDISLIPKSRKQSLEQLAELIREELLDYGIAKLTVICTHNSRRSHLGQIWLRTAARYWGLHGIFTFSGGTEATAFNPRMVEAINRTGFEIRQLDNWTNPKYHLKLSKKDKSMDLMFSKKYNDAYNPQEGYLAILVCDQADADCPLVHGAKHRFSLPYLDPKAYDDTPEESEMYDAKVREMGREILYLMQIVKEEQHAVSSTNERQFEA